MDSFKNVAAAVSFGAGILTIVVGGIHAFDTLQNAELNLDCELLDNACNKPWADVFTLAPNAFMFLWGPLFLGLLVVAVHKTKKLGLTKPKNILVMAIFKLFIITFFADLGYA